MKNVLFLKKIRILYFLPLLVIYALCSLPLPAASAATVTIAWDKNTETDVIGYTFHYGEYSHNYQYTVDVDNNTSCSISGLAEGTTYYFAVKAYNDKNLESSYSDELVYTIPNTPPTDTPPPDAEGLEADFNSGKDGFSYAPDTFNSTAKPNFSSGSYEDNGGLLGSGGLRIFLGPGSTGGATSGGWWRDFSVDQDGMAQVTLSFRLIMDEGYETNEFGEVILEIDGVRHGNDMNNSLVHVIGNGNGGGIDDTGWLTESFTVPLSAGDDHELMIGAYNNNATASDESVEVFIDNITVVTIPDTPPPPPPSVDTEPVQPVGSWLSGLNHTVEPGAKRVLVFTAHVEDNDGVPNLAGVTYGGQAMTKIIEQSVGSSTRAYVVAYILEEDGIAAASNGKFVPAWTEKPDKVAYSSMFFINVNQATPIGMSDSNTTTSLSTLPTGPLATADGDLVFVAGTCGNSGNYSVNNDFIEGLELTISSSDAVAGYKQAAGADEIPSITHSNLNRQVVVGFVVQNDSE